MEEIREIEKEARELNAMPNIEMELDTSGLKEKQVDLDVFIITFTDGRIKEFHSVPAKPLTTGKYYVIEYNGMDEITMLQEVE